MIILNDEDLEKISGGTLVETIKTIKQAAWETLGLIVPVIIIYNILSWQFSR